jgi:PKD repeat protein
MISGFEREKEDNDLSFGGPIRLRKAIGNALDSYVASAVPPSMVDGLSGSLPPTAPGPMRRIRVLLSLAVLGIAVIPAACDRTLVEPDITPVVSGARAALSAGGFPLSYTDLSTGNSSMCAVRSDGAVLCWGGDPSVTNGTPSGFDFVRVTQMSQGSTACAIRTDATGVCWGNNSHGQANVPGGTWLYLGPGIFHTCGVRLAGSMDCWASQSSGPLPGSDFVKVEAAYGFSCALRSNQSLTCWGTQDGASSGLSGNDIVDFTLAAWGGCGVRTNHTIGCWSSLNTYGQATAPAGNDYLSVSVGGVSSCALKLDHSIVCWGGNQYGTVTSPPGADFVKVRSGLGASGALRADGTIVSWGQFAQPAPCLPTDHPETNQPPLPITATFTGGETMPIALDAKATDAECDDLTFAWDLDGNGSFETAGHAASIAFDDDTSVTIPFRVDDGHGGVATATVTVNVTGVIPSGALTVLSPSPILEGTLVALAFTGVTDVSAADRAAGFEFALDCITFSSGTFTSTTTGSCLAADRNVTFFGRIRDKDGAVRTVNRSVIVQNVAPTIESIASLVAVQGTPFTRSVAFTDPGTDVWTRTVNYGDGTTVVTPAATGKTVLLSHTYASTGTFSITITVRDDENGIGTRTIPITVGPPNQAPIAVAGGAASGSEGGAVAFIGSGSSDPDGDAITFAWTFGDGGSSTAASPTHTYADNGSYTLGLTVTDAQGATSSTTRTVTIANVAPTVSGAAGATILAGEVFSLSGAFTDPGMDTHSASVQYGVGAPLQALALSAGSFTTSHLFAAAGTYTVTVRVTDDDGDVGTKVATVVVQSPQQGATALVTEIEALVAAGILTGGEASSLTSSLNSVAESLADGKSSTALNQLKAFENKVEAQRGKKLTEAQATLLVAAAGRIRASINP